CLLLAGWLHGCSTRSAIPSVSLHALWVLHQRARAEEKQQKSDLSLSLQLSFLSEPHRLAARSEDAAHSPSRELEREPCAQHALCEGATLAEESALRALGVAP